MSRIDAASVAAFSAPVVVVGGGPVGLAATLALARSGVDVILVDADDGKVDHRTSALMAPAVGMLRRLGIWELCQGDAAPLRRLRLVDDTGRLLRAPTIAFDAAEIGEEAFGWNIANTALLAAMRQRLSAMGNVERVNARVERVETHETRVELALADGRELTTAVTIAADGRESACRAAAGIRVDRTDCDQAAIVATFAHTLPHDGVSTEFHRPRGPFTLVPLPGDRSSLVWVESRRTAEALALFDDASLAEEIERLSHRALGAVSLDGPRQTFPISGLVARRLGRNRVLLVGEAAHVLPPIGAQGLNLGLRDAAATAELVAEALSRGADPGSPVTTAEYDRRRRLDVTTRTRGVDLLNRSLAWNLLPAQAARAAGLSAVGAVGPLRRMAMRAGLAPRYALPDLMRPE